MRQRSHLGEMGVKSPAENTPQMHAHAGGFRSSVRRLQDVRDQSAQRKHKHQASKKTTVKFFS